jgi:hypothetical protein
VSIHPRLNCVHTHEQNGMVKCWHQYIVEIGLTLLGQCKAPLKFWSYAFETSIYFINRMLTLVLNYKTPFESLFKSTSYYSFLRTFRCLYFPFPRPYNTHKLDFISSPCVFLVIAPLTYIIVVLIYLLTVFIMLVMFNYMNTLFLLQLLNIYTPSPHRKPVLFYPN